MNKIFGPVPWGPAIDYREMYTRTTPVGETCIDCGEIIVAGDYGQTTVLVDLEGNVRPAVQHRECLLRHVVGSVGHQLGKCSCFGGDYEDPPGMTKREAARAAVAQYMLGELERQKQGVG